MTHATFGRTSAKLFAHYDRGSRSLRTSQDIDPKDSPMFSGTVPKTGWMSAGGLYELPMSVPRTGANDCSSLLPTPTTSQRGTDRNLETRPGAVQNNLHNVLAKLLPTPTVNDAKNPDCVGTRNRRTPNLTAVSVYFPKLLPTPGASDSTGGDQHPSRRKGHSRQLSDYALFVWGDYEPAIRRWERHTRPAPNPTEPNKNGKPRLTAEFDEWMMGLPAGWVSDIDIPYGAKIKLCGNGVVPQQAELALRLLLDIERSC